MDELRYQTDRSGHRGSRAVERLIELAPASGALALWMQHRDVDDFGPQAPAVAAVSPSGPTGAISPAIGRHAGVSGLQSVERGRRRPPVGSLWQLDGPIANDGRQILYRPAFDDLSLPRQMGLVAHQLLHVALRHAARQQALSAVHGSVDPGLFNVCADAIVNSALAHLDWLELPPRAVSLDQLLQRVLGIHEPVSTSLQRWDTERLYRAIDDRRPVTDSSAGHRQPGQQATEREAPADNSTGGRQPDGPRAQLARALLDEELRDLLPADISADLTAAETDQRWSERLARARTGDGEQSLLRELLADLPQPRIAWQQVLRTQLSRSLAPLPALSWSRPTRSYLANHGRTRSGRRMPWEPGQSSSRAVPRLVIMVDVSGSVNDTLLARFATEIDRLIRWHRASAWLLIGDDQLRDEVRLQAGCREVRGLRFRGGGGTDLTPLLTAADRHQPDIGVCLTDLQGPIDFTPAWPVLWAVPPAFADTPLPFGRLLVLG